MIYLLFFNGPSIVPLFIPLIPQLVILFYILVGVFRVNLRISISLYLFVIFYIILIVFALINNELDQCLFFIKLLCNTLFSILIANYIQHYYNGKFSEIYSNAILVLSVIGIMGLIFSYFNSWEINSNIGDRTYHTNLMTVWLTDGEHNSSQTLFSPFSYRLQGFWDEPGTYGILLIPAFFYFVNSGKILSSTFIIISIFLSESFNAWILSFLILIFKLFYINSLTKRIYFILFISISSFLFFPIIKNLYEVKSGIDAAYENVSSLSVRAAEYNYLIEFWWNHLLPLQNQRILNDNFPDGISSSFVRWYLKSGIIFIFIFTQLFISLSYKFFINKNKHDPDFYFVYVLAATMFFSGLQRTSFFDNILFMGISFWVFNYQTIKYRKINEVSRN
jgi:hypothetical protein